MSNSYELTGTVKQVGDVQTFASGFTKREFVVTIDDDYPQDINLEVIKERIALLDDVQPVDRVKVAFRIRGNEYHGRHYVNLQAYQIDKLTAAPTQEQPADTKERSMWSAEQSSDMDALGF